jgi:hypothetical protein
VLAKVFLQIYFGRGDVGEVTEDGGEAPHVEELGEGDVSVDADGVDEVPFYRKTEKSCENAAELISCIFQGLRLGVVASSNIDLLASLLTLKKTLAVYLLQNMVGHYIMMRG